MKITSVHCLAAFAGLALTVGLSLGGCGNAPAEDKKAQKAAPASGHNHGEPGGHGEPGHTCPLCESMKEEAAKVQAEKDKAKQNIAPETGKTVLDNLTMKSIDGTDIALNTYKGKVVLIVNLASQCGLRTQYAELEALFDAYKDKGFIVLGFPANNFGGQEPGTDAQIKELCTTTYDLSFPLFSKVSVKGGDQVELYKRLTSAPAPFGGELKWNFTKFLLDKEGKLVSRFEPTVLPSSAEVKNKIESLLK